MWAGRRTCRRRSIAMKSLHAKLREFWICYSLVEANLSLIAQVLSTREAYCTPEGQGRHSALAYEK